MSSRKRSRLPSKKVPSNKTRLNCEWLEDRTVLSAVLFVEFGDRFAGGSLNTTEGGLRDVANTSGASNPILGVELTDTTGVYAAGTALRIVRQGYTATERAEMMAVVRRAYLPLDIEVVELKSTFTNTADGRSVRGATSMADVVNTLRSGPVTSKDSYVFAAAFVVNPGAATQATYGPTGGGTSPGNNGFGELSDLTTAQNLHDDVAVVFAFGTFNLNTANNIAHEAGHAFGLQHAITNPANNPDVNVYHSAELMSYQNTNATSSSMFTRVPMIRGDGNSPGGTPSPINYNDIEARAGARTSFDQLANDPQIGASPLYTFVSGTGQNDTITITKNGANALVSVTAYTTTTHLFGTEMLIPGEFASVYTYTIPLTKTILIYGGTGDDTITVDGDLGVNIVIDGMEGTDSLYVYGKGAASAVYTPGGLVADSVDIDVSAAPVPYKSYSGSLALGGRTIRFNDFETDSLVTVRDVTALTYRTPGGSDAIALQNPSFNQTRVTGTANGGTAVVPLHLLSVDGLTVDLGSADVAANANSLTVVVGTENPLIGKTLSYVGGAGTDTLAIAANADYTLSDSQLIYADASTVVGGPRIVGLSSIERANLTGGVGSNAFAVSGWTGVATLNGFDGADTYAIALDALAAAGTVRIQETGVGGTDVATVTAGAGPGAFDLSSTRLQVGSQQVQYTVALENLYVDGGSFADTFAVSSVAVATTLRGNGGSDTFTLGGTSNRLDAFSAALTLDGGAGADDRVVISDLTTATAKAYTLSALAFGRDGVFSVAYQNIDRFRLDGGTGANTYAIAGTGAGVSTDIVDGNGGGSFAIAGDALTGTNTFTGGAGNDRFTVRAGTGITGVLHLAGGSGDDLLDVVGRTGDDSVTVRIAQATGAGTIAGLGNLFDFDSVKAVSLDGAGGIDSLAWIDDTNTVWGSTSAPESGVIFRATGAASGTVFSRNGAFPDVGFTGFAGDFSVNGDGDGSGDRDTLTVLGVSTGGLGSAWGELLSADGADTIIVNDTGVQITNAALGTLRSVRLATTAGPSSFGTLLVRAGSEGGATGDSVTAYTSTRLNILVDGMDPQTKNADRIAVPTVGGRSITSLPASALGPVQTRIGQISDGGSLGFWNFETSPRPNGLIVTGSGAGAPAEVRAYDAVTGQLLFEPFHPFDGFLGGLTVASGDVNGDGNADIIVGAAAGQSHVVVYDGLTGQMIRSFLAFGAGFQGGVSVAAGDLDGDGFAEIIVGAGLGAGPHVEAFDGRSGALTLSFFAYPSGFHGGVNVAAGDIDGDGRAEIITGMGVGGVPLVKAFKGTDGSLVYAFFAYDLGFQGGVTVAAGDIDGDGIAEIITGAASMSVAHVKVFRAADAAVVGSFIAYDPVFTGGVSVGTADVDGDGRREIVTGAGAGAAPHVKAFKGLQGLEVFSIFAGDPLERTGVRV